MNVPHSEKVTRPNTIVQHFKRTTCTPEELKKEPNAYLYLFIGVATHTETGEKEVVYRAMYGDRAIYARPYGMFVSEVDHEKYPKVTQRYRLEVYTGTIAV